MQITEKRAPIISPGLFAGGLIFLLTVLLTSALVLAGKTGAVLVLLAVLSIWLVRFPTLAIGLLTLSIVLGQVIRVPLFGQGGGVLVSDAAVFLILAATWFEKSWVEKRTTGRIYSRGGWLHVLFFLIVLFASWSLFTLIVNAPDLDSKGVIVGVSYWARLVANLMLLPALLYLLRGKKRKLMVRKLLIVMVGALIFLGVVQLLFLPTLEAVAISGGKSLIAKYTFVGDRWDPHNNRLVSTWLDPNFFGVFVAVMIPVMSARLIITKKGKDMVYLGFLATALIATQSRSAMVALGLVGLLLSPFVTVVMLRRGKTGGMMFIVTVFLFVVLGVLLAGILLGPRMVGLVSGGPTVQLRWQNMQNAWVIARENWLLGVGYNAYQFTALKYGIISDFTIHSRAGADNSWLTLWATTGVVGMILFLVPWLAVGGWLVKEAWLRRRLTGIALVVSLAVWFIHANFVNSLLYSHMIIVVSLLIAVFSRENSSQLGKQNIRKLAE